MRRQNKSHATQVSHRYESVAVQNREEPTSIRKQSSVGASSDVEALEIFRRHLAKARTRRGIMFGREVAALCNELCGALFELKESVTEPRTGMEAVAAFFRSDEKLFEMADDSSGNLGQVFRFDACDLFVHYAAACEDKEWIAQLVLQLQEDDNYGVRDCLISAASQYLPGSIMRGIVERLWSLAHDQKEEHRQRHWLYLIESLAKQMHDPQLFEKASLAALPGSSIAQSIEIGEVYFESGDAETALKWLKKVPDDAHFQENERNGLLLRVYQKLGFEREAVETGWKIFRGYRSEETFQQLLDIIGSESRQGLLDKESELILLAKELSYSDANFLLWCGKSEDAEAYVLSHAAEFDGGFYSDVLPLAEAMEREERFLAATVLYRSLLESILARAISKYYGHGVRYLRKLNDLAPRVLRWRQITPHDRYFSELVEKNKRKSGFWTRYEARRGGRSGNKERMDDHDLG